jgi:hypothetical protein
MTVSNIISAPTPTVEASSKPVFWERLWQSAGIQSVFLFGVVDVLYGHQPGVGASADALLAFYGGNQVRILIAAAVTGLAVLNLLWFVAAVRITLADAGKDGWGAAATTSSAVFGGLVLLVTAVDAALAHSVAAAEYGTLVSGLNDCSWALLVLVSFPRAMLIMSLAFGLWRAQLISNALFTAGVALVVMGVFGGTTWMSGGYWAPDGDYARFISPSLLLVWVVVVSWVLFTRRPAARSGW